MFFDQRDLIKFEVEYALDLGKLRVEDSAEKIWYFFSTKLITLRETEKVTVNVLPSLT